MNGFSMSENPSELHQDCSNRPLLAPNLLATLPVRRMIVGNSPELKLDATSRRCPRTRGLRLSEAALTVCCLVVYLQHECWNFLLQHSFILDR